MIVGTDTPGALLVALGYALLARSRADDALDAFNRALDEEPEVHEAALAGVVTTARDHDRATAAMRLCLARVAERGAVTPELVQTAHDLLTRRRVQRQRQWIEEAFRPRLADVDLQPHADLAFLVARVDLYLGHTVAALVRLQQIVEDRPEDARILESLGDALRDSGRGHEAIAYLKTALEAARTDGRPDRISTIATKLGRALAAAGDHETALEHLTETVGEGDPYVYERMLARGESLMAVGRLGTALEAATEAERLRPKAVHPQVIKAQVYLSRHEFELALEAADRSLGTDPSSDAAIITKAQALIEGQLDPKQGRRLLRRHVKRHGDGRVPGLLKLARQGRAAEAGVWIVHGELALAGGDLPAAQAALSQAQEQLDGETAVVLAAAHRLRAALLKEEGAAEPAALALSAAGDAYIDAGMFSLAVAVLREAQTGAGADQATKWRLAFALMQLGYERQVAEEQRALFVEALETWEAANRIGAPDDDFVWSHLVRAWALVGLAMHDLDQAADHRWAAAVNLERGLILQPWTGALWALLAQVFAANAQLACALAAVEQALQIQPDDVDARGLRAWTLSAAGDPGALAELRDARAQGGESLSWLAGTEAQLVALADGPQAGLTVIGESPATPTDAIDWGLERARLLRLAGRLDDARDAYVEVRAWVAADRSIGPQTRQLQLAWLDYQLGDVQAAEQAFAEAAHKIPDAGFDHCVNRSYCAVLRGDLPAADRCFAEALEQPVTPNLLREAHLDIEELRVRVVADPDAVAACDGYLAALDATHTAYREAVTHPDAAMHELSQVLAGRGAAEGSDRWLAAVAGSAREAFAEERMADAAEHYRRIVQVCEEAFPEGRDRLIESLRGASAHLRHEQDFAALRTAQEELIGLGALTPLDADLELADAQMHVGRAGEAAQTLRSALACVQEPAQTLCVLHALARALTAGGRLDEAVATAHEALDRGGQIGALEDLAGLHALLAVSQPRALDLAGTLDCLRASLRAAADAELPDVTRPIALVFEADPALLSSSDRFATVAEALAVLSAEAADPSVTRNLRTVRLGLSRTVYRSLRHRHGPEPDSEAMMPAPIPIVFEGDRSLFPQDGETPAVVRLIDEDVPLMRVRIYAETGVQIPGLRIQPSMLGAGRYVLRLHDRQRGVGWTRPDAFFCPGATAADGSAYLSHDPMTGASGAWLASDAAATHVPAFDALAFIMRHVELVVRGHLHTFFGLPELQLLLDDRLGPEAQEAADVLLADPVMRPRVVGTALDLLRERVPLRNVEALVETMAAAGSDEPLQVLQDRVRLRLAPDLPGVADGRRLVRAGVDVEDRMSSHLVALDRRLVAAMPFVEVGELRRAVLERLEGAGPPALVVERPACRRPLWRLLQPVRPDVPVVSTDELAAAAGAGASTAAQATGGLAAGG